MTGIRKSGLGSSSRVGRQALRDDQLLNPRGGAMECHRERHSLLQAPTGDAISDFHRPSLTFRSTTVEGMRTSNFSSISTSGAP